MFWITLSVLALLAFIGLLIAEMRRFNKIRHRIRQRVEEIKAA